MAFKDSIRLEAKYFQNLKTAIASLKKWREGENPSKTEDILDSCIAANKALILLYRNVAECYNELVSLFVKQQGELVSLRDYVHALKDELNEKIDDVNNYLNGRLTELEGRVELLEQAVEDLQRRVEILENLDRVKIYTLKTEGGVRKLYDGETLATTADVVSKLSGKYSVIVKTELTSNISYIVSAYSSTAVQFIAFAYAQNTKKISIYGFRYSGNAVSNYVSDTFDLGQIATNASDISTLQTTVQNHGISITDLSGRMLDAETGLNALDQRLDTAEPYQFQITIGTTGWASFGSMYFIRIADTFDLTNAAMVTLTAGGDLTDYDNVFDNMFRSREIGLFGAFDDNNGSPATSCLQFYANSVPSDSIKVLVTVSPYIPGSTASSTVANAIY